MLFGNLQGLINGTEQIVFDHEVLSEDSLTKLLLHFDNNANDETGKAVTNNNVTFSAPGKFGGYAGSFNGSSYLSIPDSSDWNLGIGNFTIDCWVKFTSTTALQTICGQSDDAGNVEFPIYLQANGTQLHIHGYNYGYQIAVDWDWTPALNTWYHLAIVRESTNTYGIKAYINGTSLGNGTLISGAWSGTFPDISDTLSIGFHDYSGSSSYFNGYIDEFRWSKGIARWTENFTPPTSSYGLTKLLLHLDNSVVDSIGHAVTNNGVTFSEKIVTNNNVIFSAPGKFGGYAGSFNGTNAYLSIPDSTDWQFGSGDYSIETWIFATDTAYRTIASYGGGSDSWNDAAGLAWQLYFQGTGSIAWETKLGNGTATGYYYTLPTYVNGWHHLAIVRNGATVTIYFDGVSVGSASSTTIGQFIGGTPQLTVGRSQSTNYFNGRIDEVRISKGIARWTENFTPPTSEYINDNYTKLLLHLDGNNLDSSTVKKFGTHAASFNGSSSYLSIPDSDDWYFGTGDFTIDFWVNFASLPSTDLAMTIFRHGVSSSAFYNLNLQNVAGIYRWDFVFNNGSGQQQSFKTTAISTNTWYHITIVRNGNDLITFQNGIQVGTTVTISGELPNLSNSFIIGASTDGQFYGQFISGKIDEFRISKGIVRWTENFTPPTLAYNEGPVSSINTDNILNGNEDGWYTIYSFMKDSTFDGASFIAQFNNDTDYTHYGDRHIYGSGATVANTVWAGTDPSYNGARIGYAANRNNVSFGVTKMYAKSGAVRLSDTTFAGDISGAYINYLMTIAQVWNNTVDNLISMQFKTEGSLGTLGVGTRIIITKSNNFQNKVSTGVITTPYVKGSWVRVGSQILTTPTSTINFTGLDGDRDVIYFLKTSGKSAVVSGGCRVRVNNDNGIVYGWQVMRADGSDIGASNFNNRTALDGTYAGTNIDNYHMTNFLIFAKNNFVRPCITTSAHAINGTIIGEILIAGTVWNNTIDNINQLNVINQSGNWAAGSQFELYALRPNG